MEIEKIALKIAERHYSSKPNAEVDESYRLKMIETLKVQITDEFKQAQALQLRENAVSESTLTIPDIRNKLSPVTTLIEMLERGEIELAKQSIEQSKISINYLAQRDVYSH
jgi:hypothetical protein